MKSKIISVIIVGFWLVMMFTLVKDHILMSANMEPVNLTTEWRDQEEWMQLFYKGLPIGAIHTSIIRETPDSGYILRTRLLVRINLLGLKNDIQLVAGAIMDKAFILQKFLAQFNMNEKKWTVKGLVDEKTLYYMIDDGTGKIVSAAELQRPPSMLEAVRSTIGKNISLEVGKVYKIPAFDPIWGGGGGIIRVKVAAKEKISPSVNETPVEAYRIETTFNNMTTVSWVNESGETLMRQIFPDLFMRNAEPDAIKKKYDDFAEPIPTPGPMNLEDFSGELSGETLQGRGLQGVFEALFMKNQEDQEN